MRMGHIQTIWQAGINQAKMQGYKETTSLLVKGTDALISFFGCLIADRVVKDDVIPEEWKREYLKWTRMQNWLLS